jgi:hypothetical protein
LVVKSDPPLVDPQGWSIVPNSTEFEMILIHHAIKRWFKLPSIVRAGPSLR